MAKPRFLVEFIQKLRTEGSRFLNNSIRPVPGFVIGNLWKPRLGFQRFPIESSESQCARDRSGNTAGITEGKAEELERIARSGRRPDGPKTNSAFGLLFEGKGASKNFSFETASGF
jgi:hypothetical protein